MKYYAITSITLLAVFGFIFVEFLVGIFDIEGAFKRLFFRLGFQAQIFLIIYLLFEVREILKKLKYLEWRIIKITRFRHRNVKNIKRTNREEDKNAGKSDKRTGENKQAQ